MKKIALLILALVLCLTAAACSSPEETSEPDASNPGASQDSSPADLPAGAALSVNGRTLSDDFIDASVESIAHYYDYTGMTTFDEFMATDSLVERARDNVLESYTRQLAAIAKAEALGMSPVTEEERALMVEESEAQLEILRMNMEEYASLFAANNLDSDPSSMAEDLFNYQLASYGLTEDNFVEGMTLMKEVTMAQDFLTQDIVAGESDYKAYFDEQYAAQKAEFESSPSIIGSYYDAGSLLYYPEGSRYVKHILVKIDDEAATEAQVKYGSDPEGALASIADELAAIQPTVDEIMAKIASGADFDALIAEYGEDGGMTVEPGLSTGYFMYPGITTYYQEFTDAGMALEKVGDVSEPAATVYGYHILKYVSDPEPITADTMSQSMKDAALQAKKDQYIADNMDAWVSETTVARD